MDIIFLFIIWQGCVSDRSASEKQKKEEEPQIPMGYHGWGGAVAEAKMWEGGMSF